MSASSLTVSQWFKARPIAEQGRDSAKSSRNTRLARFAILVVSHYIEVAAFYEPLIVDFYSPLFWLHTSTFLTRPIEWYVNLFN